MIPHPQRCDVEKQCQHFCVYKQMVCPVYIRCASYTFTTDRESLDILDAWCLREVRNRTIANGGVAFVALREVIKHLRTSVISERDEVLNLVAHEINELWNFDKISEEVYINFIDKIRELRTTPAPVQP